MLSASSLDTWGCRGLSTGEESSQGRHQEPRLPPGSPATEIEHGCQRGLFGEAETLWRPTGRAWGRVPHSPLHTLTVFQPSLPPVSAPVSVLVMPSVTEQAHTEQSLSRRGLVPSDHRKALSLQTQPLRGPWSFTMHTLEVFISTSIHPETRPFSL